MKNLFLILALMFLHFAGYSQKKKTRTIPPPVPKAQIVNFSQKPLKLQEYGLPILFEWKMNADTTLKPGTEFKKQIKLTYGETEVNGFYSTLPLTLKKTKAGKDAPEPKIEKMITSVNYYNAAVVDDVITLKERGRIVMALKVFYDKNNQVSHLKDVNNGAVYLHIPSEEQPVVAP